jgi:hypothetical protein
LASLVAGQEAIRLRKLSGRGIPTGGRSKGPYRRGVQTLLALHGLPGQRQVKPSAMLFKSIVWHAIIITKWNDLNEKAKAISKTTVWLKERFFF